MTAFDHKPPVLCGTTDSTRTLCLSCSAGRDSAIRFNFTHLLTQKKSRPSPLRLESRKLSPRLPHPGFLIRGGEAFSYLVSEGMTVKDTESGARTQNMRGRLANFEMEF
ncbi:hypothetical protein GE061_007488 [Apolygus lucorum]|uniref:Uncharacterized protein n=1 Tax=Apolygus lucorum TaxID=248454 RepID=A0A8S9WRU5_APOLU|nr:hypothetical protein GE061_007488 [Apolygus lucorum]